MTHALFLRHFETEIDPTTPVDQWRLSERGEESKSEFVQHSGVVELIDRVYSSPEPKAANTAETISNIAGVDCTYIDGLREVDRSGEGFIEPPSRYVEMVETYLSDSQVTFDWEPRTELDQRANSALKEIDDSSNENETALVVTHGMWMSRVLSNHLEQDAVEFWHELEFGEVVELDLNTIRIS